MTSTQLISGSAGDMIQQLAASAGMTTASDPTLWSEIAAVADSVPELAALSVADRRAAMGTVMVDLNWGDPEDDAVPGGPHIIRRRAEKILAPNGRGPLADPQRVAEALCAAADAFELADLSKGAL